PGHGADPLVGVVLGEVVGEAALPRRGGAHILIDLQILVDPRPCRVAASLQIAARLLRCGVGALPIRRLRAGEGATGDQQDDQENYSAHGTARDWLGSRRVAANVRRPGGGCNPPSASL